MVRGSVSNSRDKLIPARSPLSSRAKHQRAARSAPMMRWLPSTASRTAEALSCIPTAEAVVEGRCVGVVSPGYLREHGLVVQNERVRKLGDGGNTVVYVLLDEKLIGAVALADAIRKESFDAVARLRAMGIRCMMVTGDATAVAKSVAGKLALDDYFAEVLPHQKVEKVREVKALGLTVAMIGDGVNDAPALVESDLGIAIGAGTDVAIESADVVLVRSDPRDVFAIVTLSRATYAKMVQNLVWATGYNAFAIPLAARRCLSVGRCADTRHRRCGHVSEHGHRSHQRGVARAGSQVGREHKHGREHQKR
jgi:P-type Cu2+ transporter